MKAFNVDPNCVRLQQVVTTYFVCSAWNICVPSLFAWCISALSFGNVSTVFSTKTWWYCIDSYTRTQNKCHCIIHIVACTPYTDKRTYKWHINNPLIVRALFSSGVDFVCKSDCLAILEDSCTPRPWTKTIPLQPFHSMCSRHCTYMCIKCARTNKHTHAHTHTQYILIYEFSGSIPVVEHLPSLNLRNGEKSDPTFSCVLIRYYFRCSLLIFNVNYRHFR